MSSGSHSPKPYLLVLGALAVLTAIEVWAAVTLGGTAKWLSLVVVAVVKAGCVGWWYMHLKSEYGWLKFVAILPVIAGAYAVVLMAEVVAR